MPHARGELPARLVRQAGAAVVAILLSLSPLSAEPAYLSRIDDLPIAEGLEEVPGEGMVFDSAYGRVVTAVARGRADISAVRTFYRRVLPALGWEQEAGNSYRRDGERLTILLRHHEGSVTASFHLAGSST